MIELLTGIVLATAAGLNAYVPLLGLGLLAKFTSIVSLPDGWAWLSSDLMLIIVSVLLVIELFVDKVPMLDTVNDVLQTAIRPAAGGMVFAAGAGSETVAIDDPGLFNDRSVWMPIVAGIIIALIPHILKLISRPLINTVTGGAGASVASTLEDAGAVSLTLLAVVVPVLAFLLVIFIIFFIVRRIKKARLSKENRASTEN